MPPYRPVEERLWEKVDKSGECWLWTGHLNHKGYGHFNAGKGRIVRAHKFIYEMMVGPVSQGLMLDHRVTCPRHCVNPAHLKPVTAKENNENRHGPAAHNTSSGVLGVHWHERSGKWRARVNHDGKEYHLGLFPTIEEAEEVVVAKRIELYTNNQLDRMTA